MIIEEVLRAAIETNRERDAVYRDGWRTQAEILSALYPNGIPPGQASMERLSFIAMITAKLTRYVLALPDGPHLDSLHDLGIYAFMLEQMERDKLDKEKAIEELSALNLIRSGQQ